MATNDISEGNVCVRAWGYKQLNIVKCDTRAHFKDGCYLNSYVYLKKRKEIKENIQWREIRRYFVFPSAISVVL
jgi:hypothetical protein